MMRLWVHIPPCLGTSKDARAENEKGRKCDCDRDAKLWTSRKECCDCKKNHKQHKKDNSNDMISRYLHKASNILVEGSLRSDRILGL